MTVIERPIIFNRLNAVIIINLIWIGLFSGGFYCLWQVNPKIVLVIIGIYAVFWTFSYFMRSDKSKAKKIFKTYRQLKLFRPKASNEEILREIAITYFKELKWDEHKIRITVEGIFEKRADSKKDKDIKDVVTSILTSESPYNDFNSRDFRTLMEYFSKKEKAVNDAYNIIIGNAEKTIERPKLSKSTTKWVKSTGRNPDEMTNEQLAVFSEMDDHRESSRAINILHRVAYTFTFLALISLINLHVILIVVNVIIALVAWFICFIIQTKRINKNFREASIIKYVQEQAKKNK